MDDKQLLNDFLRRYNSYKNIHSEIENARRTQGSKNEESSINQEKIKNLKSDRELRETFSKKIYKFACVYCLLALTVVVLNKWIGIDKWPLSVLIGSTATSVFACLQALSSGVFKNNSNNP